MAHTTKNAIILASILMLALTVPTCAQVQVGENANLNLSGNVAFGYNGDFTNYAGSDHGFDGSGTADLNGYYYAPGFISFDVQPFYNQSRANSQYQSVFQSSGVSANASFFSGSNFPGTVTYSKSFNNEGGFSLPGLGNITTNGNSQTLGIGWGIRIPDLPKVSFQFADGDSANSVFGPNLQATSHTDTFQVNVSHTIAGFNLNGGYQYNMLHSLIPGFLNGEPAQTSDSYGSSFNLGASHDLPLNGTFLAGFSRSDVSSDYVGGNYNTVIDVINGGAGFQPISNLNLSVSTQYTNNLAGSLYQSIITAGGVVPPALLQYSTQSLGITSQANYMVPSLHLTFGVTADRQEQTVLGGSLASNSFHEMVTYGNYLLGGFLNATAGVTETSVSAINSSSMLGFLENVSYLHQVGNWDLSGSFSYSRNSQTVLIAYTSSGYGYSAGIGRKLGKYAHWNFNAGGMKSNIDNVSGSGSFNQTYSTGLSLKRFSVSGSYAKSDGTSILTSTGLTQVPIPVAVLTPAQVLLFAGKSYSAGASVTPIHGLMISGSYSKALSNTQGIVAFSSNTTEQVVGQLQYKLRQLWITAGYLKLVQGFTIVGPPTSGSSFYVGISRWFKFF